MHGVNISKMLKYFTSTKKTPNDPLKLVSTSLNNSTCIINIDMFHLSSSQSSPFLIRDLSPGV